MTRSRTIRPHGRVLAAATGVLALAGITVLALTFTATPGLAHELLHTGLPVNLDILDAPDDDPTRLDNELHTPATAGTGALVYIVDSGVQGDLPAFNGHVTPGYDAYTHTVPDTATDCDGHGTTVASVITGPTGIAPNATIIPVKAFSCSPFDPATIADALAWIRTHHPAGTTGIVNISSGTDPTEAGTETGATGYFDTAVRDLVDAGFFVTVSAGNDSDTDTVVDACNVSPANIPGAFVVAATSQGASNTRASFSNSGPCISAYAPGEHIEVISHTTGDHFYANGTSYSAPAAAGLAALLVAEDPALTAAGIREQLLAHAIPAMTAAPGNPLDANTHYLPGPDAPALAENTGTDQGRPVPGTYPSTRLTLRIPFDRPAPPPARPAPIGRSAHLLATAPESR